MDDPGREVSHQDSRPGAQADPAALSRRLDDGAPAGNAPATPAAQGGPSAQSAFPAPSCRPPSGPDCALLDRIGTAVWVYGFHQHRIIWANRAALVVWKADSIEGLRQRDMTPTTPAAHQRLESYATTFANGNALCEDWTIFPRDEPVNLECWCRGLTWEGEPAMMVEARVLAYADPDQAPPVPDAVRRAVEVLRGVPFAVVLLLADGTIVSQNVSADVRFGPMDSGAFSQAFVYRTDYEALISDALSTGEAPPRVVPVNTRTTMAWFEIGARRLRDPATAAPAVMVYAIDVTQRRMQEEALRSSEARLRSLARDLEEARDAALRANAAKSDFLAMMSHEIRTPMNGILGLTDQLLAANPQAVQVPSLTAIRESAEALLSVINDILDFSRLEAGRLDMEAVPFRLRAVVEAALDLLRPTAERKGLFLVLEMAAGLPLLVRGDPGRVRQILLNIVGNAVKFTERGGITVSVGSGGEPDVIRLVVRDTGIGIAPEVLPRLFDRFAQADASIAQRFGGSGLGLVISRRLAGLMGGAITVNSSPGQGSEFAITLRLPTASSLEARALATRETQAIGLPPGADGGPLRILIAEDNEINRAVLSGYLASQQVALTIATTGLEAAEEAGRTRFDAILMDMRMPGLDGPEAARRIRDGGGPSATVPIIAVTANAFADDRARCLAAGMTEHLAKPVRRDALFQALNAALAEATPGDPPADDGSPAPPIRPADRPAVCATDALASALQDADAPQAVPGGTGGHPPVAEPPPASSAALAGASPMPPPPAPLLPVATAMPDPIPSAPSPLLDEDYLLDMEEDLGREILVTMARQFLAAIPDRQGRIAETLTTQALADCGREAHSLKGVAATLGLQRVREIAAAIDQACRSGGLDDARRQAEPLAAALDDTRTALLTRFAGEI